MYVPRSGNAVQQTPLAQYQRCIIYTSLKQKGQLVIRLDITNIHQSLVHGIGVQIRRVRRDSITMLLFGVGDCAPAVGRGGVF